MRRLLVILLMTGMASAQNHARGCDCGQNAPGPPTPRSLKPYGGVPDDLRPFSRFTTPYHEFYQDLVEYNGAARELPDPDLKDVSEVRIGFIGPISNHPDQIYGNRMLNGAALAVDEANAGGGYCGRPFRLMVHNDSATWGAASNEIVTMVYDEKVWAMFGSISSDTTHIALRVTLKAETPIVNSASTDPTIPETIIPWYFTNLQDDRLQGYTLARHIYSELGLKRVGILRVNDRYGRFGVLKFRDASRRLGHPIVIEQKFMPGDTDFRRQLQIIEDSRVDAIVLWSDIGAAAAILKQMQEAGMKQRVFGSHRTIGDELIQLAGPAAENFEAVFPYDPTRGDGRWLEFDARYSARFHEKPDHFAALAYDAMQTLLGAICRAGLNKGRIRDALAGTETYKGVTGDMVFDPNSKNISPLFLAHVRNGAIVYRRITMEKPYARMGENDVRYSGPQLPDEEAGRMRIAVFGPHAEEAVRSPEVAGKIKGFTDTGRELTLIPIASGTAWGKASDELVHAVYQERVLAVIALDRSSGHLAEQIAVKSFLPVIAISADLTLTSANIPWIFRLPEGSPLTQALGSIFAAIGQVGANRARIREFLASGAVAENVRFNSRGESIQ